MVQVVFIQINYYFIICFLGFIGFFFRVGIYLLFLDCFDVCGEDEGVFFFFIYNGFFCWCGGVIFVKSIVVCGVFNVEFLYVYKLVKSLKVFKFKVFFGIGRKKLGKGLKN